MKNLLIFLIAVLFTSITYESYSQKIEILETKGKNIPSNPEEKVRVYTENSQLIITFDMLREYVKECSNRKTLEYEVIEYSYYATNSAEVKGKLESSWIKRNDLQLNYTGNTREITETPTFEGFYKWIKNESGNN